MARMTVADMWKGTLDKLTEEGKIREVAGLKIARENGGCDVTIWRGKARKPYANFRFRSKEAADAYVAREIESAKASEVRRTEARALADKRLAEMKAALVPGAIVVCSWGYEQTNVDFYEVVDRPSESFVTLREIAYETVPGSEGFMSDRVRPRPGDFRGKPFRKKITRDGIKITSYSSAFLTSADAEHYRSWYA